MKTLLLFVLSLFISIQLPGQTVTGYVFDASTGEPLIYASIGVTETSVGTITDEKGNFKLEVKNLPNKSVVRFSMIGFKAQTFTIEELANKENTIRLAISKESGWVAMDLNKYNLVFEGKIALTLEWIKVAGLDMNKFIHSNGIKQLYPAVTFNVKQKEGLTYSKWGTEAKWAINNKSSPSIYLTIQ